MSYTEDLSTERFLDQMTALMDACEKSAVNASEMEEDFYECVNGLIETLQVPMDLQETCGTTI